MTGKWSRSGIPHKGWTCVNVEDLEEPSAICEMCESQEIRYVHYMTHPDNAEMLGVGCVCAEKMEQDYEAPRMRERVLRSASQRRRNWLRRKWRISHSGNSYLNTDGLNISIFRKGSGNWGGRILERSSGRSVESRKRYATEDAAKLGAFDGMIFLKAKGWAKT
ncbi:MAG: hypothetical protein E5X86_11605 [Mesorhizobium sp.]|uniref:hypothetical protein n=1 Tax=Mesorhizobium sp. TaxID=1871066 RepID=UPI00121B6FD9|nr:hypothetical protein [Mesorhizobium sp.]TIO17536.1 MAG: hypothetical protein E5X86_11605 [Mesorhizobium sp.]TIP88059.1 MAG: hypothetical protein E5X58_29045 [Mesorhizobium sp.]